MDGGIRTVVANGGNHVVGGDGGTPAQPTPPKIKRGFIRLRRDENCIQWGFRILGGNDTGMPLQVIKVTPQSLAAKKGLRPGDIILKICKSLVSGMTNEHAKMEILRAGNELDLVIERDFSKVPPKPAPKVKPRPKSCASELDQDLECFQCFVNPQMQSRSFRILQETLDRLPPDEAPAPTVIPASPSQGHQGVYQENDTQWSAPNDEVAPSNHGEVAPSNHEEVAHSNQEEVVHSNHEEVVHSNHEEVAPNNHEEVVPSNDGEVVTTET
ncbi:PDZ and LIM domain protein 1-like [Argonauta hians]